MRVFTYVIVHDDGSAPNYDALMTTLAICKPRIRRSAEVGDLVMAFSSATLSPEPHSVRWAGVVAEKLTFSQYWNDPRFASKKPARTQKSDNIYRPHDGGLMWVKNLVHGPDSAATDLSGEHVLCLAPLWQFGDAAPVLPIEFGLRMVGGRRGHRVSQIGESTWQTLRNWLDEQTGREGGRASRLEKRGRGCGPASPKNHNC
ncbi:MAG: hypothetical protein WD051_01860 [Steroidobacteraceae bacterium]